MRKKYFISLLLSIAVVLAACDKERPTLYENDPAIYFDNILPGNRTIPIYIDSVTVSFFDIVGDEYTTNVKVLTQGMLDFENDRYFTVRQKSAAPDEKRFEAAIPGVDYVALDDPSVSSELYIPAGERFGNIPITLKRSEHVIAKQVELTLELVANDEFRLGMQDKLFFKVKYSAQPEQPSNWTAYWKGVFGDWGPEKHKFIIQTLGPMEWNYVSTPAIVVSNYWKGVMRTALQEYNLAHPDDNLREPEEYGGAFVTFP